MKRLFIICFLSCLSFAVFAQDEKDGGNFKENLFTGGSVSLSFFDGAFLVGANPVFGYSLTNWADAGLVFNYTYASYKDYYNLGYNDKLRQSIYGGGAFLRIFPFRSLFAQAQFEHNWITAKYIAASGSPGYADQKITVDANSFLVGAGYCTGRDGQAKSVYGYFSIMFDIVRDKYSPYVDGYDRSLPIVRAGIHVPLFQGRN
jgi:hypothetical protein